MNGIGAKLSSGRLVPVIFHIILWTIWIGLPIINAGDNERWRNHAIWLIPASLAHIPLFLINTEILIPRVLRAKGVPTYLLSMLLLILSFACIQYGIRSYLIPAEVRMTRNVIFWSIVPVIFATAISTGYGFITYFNKQEKDRQEEQQERLRSELSFLRSQISPHFMFNILNSIVYLIRSKSDLAEPVTIQLSELMRYMLYTSSGETVSLEKELNYLRNYVDLQRIRFEEDVVIKLQIEGEINDQLIDPMLLIPFVENAFKHGVGMVPEPEIDIRAAVKGNDLHFTVKNKLGPESQEDKDPSSGIGLRNVSRRLELLYPQTHQLTINQQTEWYTVDLHLQLSAARPELPSNYKASAYEATVSGRG